MYKIHLTTGDLEILAGFITHEIIIHTKKNEDPDSKEKLKQLKRLRNVVKGASQVLPPPKIQLTEPPQFLLIQEEDKRPELLAIDTLECLAPDGKGRTQFSLKSGVQFNYEIPFQNFYDALLPFGIKSVVGGES